MDTNIEELSLEELATNTNNSIIRADMWGDLVNWKNRRLEQDGFLAPTLKKHGCRKVLDAASGDGIDALYLIENGFEVTTNEHDIAFRKIAIKNACKLGIELEPDSFDWRELTSNYGKNIFDAVVCIGNSIVCLPYKNEIPNALTNFYSVLNKDGILIIDERNYQKVIDNREAALIGALQPSGKFLYTGTDKVIARFSEVTCERVIHEYTHLKTGKKAYYQVYPLKNCELEEMLYKVGFSIVTKLSDYETTANSNADFFQYVCIK